jgi:hypothetical protein
MTNDEGSTNVEVRTNAKMTNVAPVAANPISLFGLRHLSFAIRISALSEHPRYPRTELMAR